MRQTEKDGALWTGNFITILVVNLLLGFCNQMLPSAQPLHMRSLGAGDELVGWLAGAATAATLLTRPFTAGALTRFNRKALILSGLTGFSLVAAAYYFFPFVRATVVIRAIQGAVWGFGSTVNVTTATDMIPKKRFGEGLGIFGLSTSLPLATAPGISLAIYNSFGMKPVVITSVCIALAATAAALRLKGEESWEPVARPGGFPFEGKSAWPAVVMGSVLVPYGAVSAFLALYAAQKGIGNVGWFFLVYAGTVLLTRPVAGKLADRIGFGTAVPAGIVFMLGGLFLIARSESVGMFMASAVLYGMSYGTLEPNLHALALLRANPGRSGAANATFSTGVDSGIGIGSVLAGVLASALGYGGMFSILCFFPALTAVLFIAFRITSNRRKTEKS